MADTLTLTITENIDNSTGGYEYNYTTTETLDQCEAYTATSQSFVHGDWTSFAKFGTTLGLGTYKKAKVRYMRFANTDNTNFTTIMLSDSTNNKQVTHKLQAGQVLYFIAKLGEGFLFNCSGSTTAATADVVRTVDTSTAFAERYDGNKLLAAMDDGSSVAAAVDEIFIKYDTAAVVLATIIVYDL